MRFGDILRGKIFCGVALCALLAVTAIARADDEDKFRVNVSVGWGGCYRPMRWTPVEVEVTSLLAEPFGGVVRLNGAQDDLTELTVDHPFVLTPRLTLQAPMATKLTYAFSDLDVDILSASGGRVWSRTESWDMFGGGQVMLTPLNDGDLLIGLAGRGEASLASLGKHAQYDLSGVTPDANLMFCGWGPGGKPGFGKVHVERKAAGLLPWDWPGYDSLNVLVLYDLDWGRLNTHQSRAIVDWVHRGGKLLVVLGTEPLAAGHPLAAMLPVQIGPAREVTLSREDPTLWISFGAGKTVTAWPLTPKPGARLSDDNLGIGGQLFAAGQVGFGEVAVLAFDPAALALPTDPENRVFASDDPRGGEPEPSTASVGHKFWAFVLKPLLANGSELMLQPPDEDNSPQWYHQQADAGAMNLNNVLEHLLRIPELRPISIFWVILLLGLLAVLLGPVDYFVLKRLDRQPLTWVTSTLCVLGFTVAAYFGVQALRSGDMQLRAVSVVDAVQGQPGGWSTTWAGLFAPDSDNYELTGLDERQWFSAVTPTEHYWYGYRRPAGDRKVYCVQQNGANLPYALPINIWSMQCLAREAPVESVPIFATVKRDGDQVTLEIANHSNSPIAGGWVHFQPGRGIQFGTVGPGQRREFTGLASSVQDPMAMNMPGPPGDLVRTAVWATGVTQRSHGAKEYIADGAALVVAEFDNAPLGMNVKDRPCNVNHIQYVRLVVYPEDESDF